jgi:hypothetical protein
MDAGHVDMQVVGRERTVLQFLVFAGINRVIASSIVVGDLEP